MIGVRFAVVCLLLLITSPARSSLAQTPPQRLSIGGAQSLTPQAEKFSIEFKKDHPHIDIEIKRGNSNYAVAAVERREIEIGLVARTLTGAEAASLRVASIGHDALIVLSYSWNTVKNLTFEQLREI